MQTPPFFLQSSPKRGVFLGKEGKETQNGGRKTENNEGKVREDDLTTTLLPSFTEMRGAIAHNPHQQDSAYRL